MKLGTRKAVADRRETGVAAEPRPKRCVADETEADCGNDRTQHATGARMQDTGRHDDDECGPERKRKCA